jgi:hypothetical protein
MVLDHGDTLIAMEINYGKCWCNNSFLNRGSIAKISSDMSSISRLAPNSGAPGLSIRYRFHPPPNSRPMSLDSFLKLEVIYEYAFRW